MSLRGSESAAGQPCYDIGRGITMAIEAQEIRRARLEGGYEQINERLGGIEQRLASFEHRFTSELTSLRSEMASLRSEMATREDVASLQSELRTELRSETASLRAEMRARDSEL